MKTIIKLNKLELDEFVAIPNAIKRLERSGCYVFDDVIL